MWVHGPCYETPAEIAALRRMSVCAVGMSAGPELARCRELGIPAAVVSCITNNCCERSTLTHDHVVQTARSASSALVALIRDGVQSGTWF